MAGLLSRVTSPSTSNPAFSRFPRLYGLVAQSEF